MNNTFHLSSLLFYSLTACSAGGIENKNIPDILSRVIGYLESGGYIYRDISYARDKRFMPPADLNKWGSICSWWESIRSQAECIGWYDGEQIFAFLRSNTYQKCLWLNILMAGLNDGRKRPIIVCLHSGIYSAGFLGEFLDYDDTNFLYNKERGCFVK